MSRQQRRRRTELPPDVWADPHGYLCRVFPGYQGVCRRGEVWCLRIGGRLVPLGTSLEVRSTVHVQARLHELGLLPSNAAVPVLWSRKTLLPALRRALVLEEQGAVRP